MHSFLIMETPEFYVSLLDALVGAMEQGRAPAVVDQIRGEIEDIQRRAVVQQDRHETLAMGWSGVGFRASNILRDQIPAFREAAVRHRPTTLEELIPRVSNEHQKDILHRLRYGSEARQIYLSRYTPYIQPYVGRVQDLEGEFTVLGTRNRHGERESYEIKWYKDPTARGSFWCNCPDHKFNSRKKHIVCKHICFLVCKVARIMDAGFFETQRLTQEQHALFLRTIAENTIFSDRSIVRQNTVETPRTGSQEQRRSIFMECRKPIEPEDSCPICYDDLASTPCLNCPTCSNNVHRECMEVWLERSITCVYCRSTIWLSWR